MPHLNHDMGSLSTLLLSCLQRKQRPSTEQTPPWQGQVDERPPVPAKDTTTSSSESGSKPAHHVPTYTYTYTYRPSEKCASLSECEKNAKPNSPTKLTKRSSIRIVSGHDSENTLVSSSASTATSTTSEGQTLAGSRCMSRSGSEEKDVEAIGSTGGERATSAHIEAGLEDLEKQMRFISGGDGQEEMERSRSLPEIKSRVFEDIPEEEEMGGAAQQQQREKEKEKEKELPSLPKEAHIADKESTEEDDIEERDEQEDMTRKSKSFRDSLRLSGRKSLIEMVHFLQPPTNRLSGLKLPIPPKSPLRKRASVSSMPPPSDYHSPASPTTAMPSAEGGSDSPTPRTKKHRRMGAVGISMGMGLPLRVRQSLDGLNTGTSSLFR